MQFAFHVMRPQANEKIYLVRQINEEWLFGRNRRGCEGMFPANFVEIKIPIPSSDGVGQQAVGAVKTTFATSCASTVVRVLYDFNAETMDDLTIKVSF
jgi:SH3 domain-containing protein 19